jgi:membrane fusion protein, multidrug efflux system
VNWTKNLIFMAGTTLLLLAGCADEAGQAGGGFQRPPTPVEAALVAIAPVTDSFSTVGSIEAGEAIIVTSEIDGMVTAIPFREGGPVTKGDLIAQLDDAQLKAEVQRAKALFAQTKATWDRVRSIVDQGAGAPQDLDDALAALKVAEANLALAETRLEKTRITAPFSGLTGKRKISHGSFLRAGSAITSLAQIEKLRVTFAIPERILASLKVGAEVNVTTTAFADKPLVGTIDVIEPQLDPLTRNVAVVALLDNRDGLLRPGMSATIDLVLKRRANAMTVPSEAVFVEGGQAFVYLIKPDSTVTRTALTLGTRLAAVVEVVAGLSDGQQVVKAGHQKLYEGAKVAPVTAETEEGGAAR